MQQSNRSAATNGGARGWACTHIRNLVASATSCAGWCV